MGGEPEGGTRDSRLVRMITDSFFELVARIQ
jgi:hypothetical protein